MNRIILVLCYCIFIIFSFVHKSKSHQEAYEFLIEEFGTKDTQVVRDYYFTVIDDANTNNAICSLYVKDITSSLSSLINEEYYIYTDTENMRFVSKKEKTTLLILSVKDITCFKQKSYDEIKEISKGTIILEDNPKRIPLYIFIQYSKNNSVKNLILEFNGSTESRLYNYNALIQRNIFEFLNENSHQESNIINL